MQNLNNLCKIVCLYLNQQFSEMEPLNRDRLTQVLAICSDLEDLIRDTAGKRKKYPQQIEEVVNRILQRRREILVSKLFIGFQCNLKLFSVTHVFTFYHFFSGSCMVCINRNFLYLVSQVNTNFLRLRLTKKLY